MAVITPTFEQPVKGVVVVTWASMNAATSDTGAPVTSAQYSRKYIQTKGTYAGTSIVTIKGSNDGTNLVILKDINGDNIAPGADLGFEIYDNPLAITPTILTGTGVVTVTLTLSKD